MMHIERIGLWAWLMAAVCLLIVGLGGAMGWLDVP